MLKSPSFNPGAIETRATPIHAGLRLDRYLSAIHPAFSRSRIKSLIEAGCVSCNDDVVRQPAEAVREGQVYALRLPPPLPAQPQPQAIPLTIVYEDAELIVLDKPAGLVVHPAPGNLDGTLVNALLAHCGDTLPGIGGERRPGIVHRLDKDTSGLMVVAKSERALATLSACFAARDLDREYVALVWGLTSAAGEIDAAIGRDPRDRKRMAVVSRGGKAALTRYSRTRSWQGALSLLTCRLATGRTHQIRVHLSAAGHPLVGDPVYLRRSPAAARQISDPLRGMLLDFPRQALHAAELGFAHPLTGQLLQFRSDLPADFRSLLSHLD